MCASRLASAPHENLSSILETATIEKQRKELQLLIGELKDRDKELNGMVAEHQRQQLSWEGDRQKVLTLEERCSKLENELHKRSEIIRTLTKRIKILECQQNDRQVVLETTQMQLQELAEKAAGASLRCEELEGKNHNLNSSVMDLSAQVGQLQAREQALTTMISLKDKDIIEAVNHIVDCSSKFKLLEHALCDAKVVESCIIKEKQDYKQKLKALKFEMNKLRDDLSEKIAENNEQREEIIRLKQEKSSLHDELIFTGEREKRKEQLLEIAKSKQERTDTQLHNLRQIYVKQQSDLQFLHFNMENSQELMQTCDSNEHDSKVHETSKEMVLSDLENSNQKVTFKRERNQKVSLKDLEFDTTQVQPCRAHENSCDVYKGEKEEQVNASDEKSNTITSYPLRGSVQELKTLLKKDAMEDNSSNVLESGRKALVDINSPKSARNCEISPNEIQNREKYLNGASDHKHWHDLSVYMGLPNCSRSKEHEKLHVECQDQMSEAAEISFLHMNETNRQNESNICESACCHPSNFIVEAPCHASVSDLEWMKIFKPTKVERTVRHRTVCLCSGTVCGVKGPTLKSQRIVSLHSRCLGSPLISTLKKDKLLKCKQFHEADLPSETNNSCEIHSDPKSPVHQDDCSPTSKLQHLLEESRQMVANLELSTMLPIRLGSPSSSPNTTSELAESKEICKTQLPATDGNEIRLARFSI
ncbi:coiled-coil domain-containing protein 62 isoform X2 [Ornithorhynchus anatinus]|uniref:coiled-coil domain-containing protein 62 isoform X2 n=1 Tax=Ornithorhynchus anatinus TaxID=9258 RepID=UPI0010A8FCD7|nr:coiled-coil domain-containing protein 62 isoform X2 [Ornithorhynchus anatinus]XP_028908432.1 coiled-coil domain-containing protein 62 isoform X2 [Ornithorhynchus anatinus]